MVNEQELKEIEYLKNTLIIIGQFETGQVDWEETAKENYKQGIRKIPEGSIVISKEEYEGLKKRVHALEHLATNYSEQIDWDNDARKETAKEILQKIYDEMEYYSCQPAIKQLAQEYGVEVEE